LASPNDSLLPRALSARPSAPSLLPPRKAAKGHVHHRHLLRLLRNPEPHQRDRKRPCCCESSGSHVIDLNKASTAYVNAIGPAVSLFLDLFARLLGYSFFISFPSPSLRISHAYNLIIMY